MNLKNVNENYHLESKLQKRVMSRKNFTYRILISVIDRYLGKDKKVADLGSGVGTLDFYLAARGNLITGFEFSRLAVGIAKKNTHILGLEKQIQYFRTDLSNIKTKHRYDAVLMTEVIEHLLNGNKILRIANKMLKNDGVFIISTRALNAPLNKLKLTKFHDKKVGHLCRYTLYELERLLSKYGFHTIEKGETEGLLRDFLFSFPWLGSQVVRAANKFDLISDLLTRVDNLLLRVFGASQIYLVAKK